MPAKPFKDIFGDSSDIIRLGNSLKSSAQNSKSIADIIAFSKALAECSIPEGYLLIDAYNDIAKIGQDWKKLRVLWDTVLRKHPEYVVCLPLMLTGLTAFAVQNANEIYKEIKKYSKGALNILPNIAKGIVKALNVNLEKVGLEALNQIIDGATAMGLGYLSYQTEKGLDRVEQEAMNAAARVGKVMALYMTLFTEFRWAMILLFVENVKGQIDDRIQRINEVRKAYQKLEWEHFISSAQVDADQRERYLARYKDALQKLESTIPIVRTIEKKLYKKSSLDKNLNDRVKHNLDAAKDLLLKERNTFIEHFYKDTSISDVGDPDSMWKFYLSNDYTNVSVVEDAPIAPVFWKGNPHGEDIYIKKVFVGVKVTDTNKLIITSPNYGNILPPRPTDNIWVEQKTTFDTTLGDYVKIDKNLFKVKRIEKIFIPNSATLQVDEINPVVPAAGTVLNWYCDGYKKVTIIANGTGGSYTRYEENSPVCGYVSGGGGGGGNNDPTGHTAIFLLLESKTLDNFHIPIFIDKTVELYREMTDSSFFDITHVWKTFTFDSNGGYIIKDIGVETGKKAPPFSLNIKKGGIEFIRKIWKDSKNYSLYLFFGVGDFLLSDHILERSFKMLGTYPNMVEKESERREKVLLNDLPEPYKSMFNNYDFLKDKKINKLTGDDVLNIGGSLSTFLYGRDIIKENVYKFKNDVLSYDRYLETCGDFLSQMCPLKNNYFYFYTLMNTLENLDTDIDITNTIVLRDWIAIYNRTILDTLTSMTRRYTQQQYEKDKVYKKPSEMYPDGYSPTKAFRNKPGPATESYVNEYLTIKTIKESPFMVALVPSALLDIDNIEMMKLLVNMDNEMGTGLNKNRELQKKYFKLMNFIKWLRTMKVVERLKAGEDQVWTNIHNSILSSVNLMLKGKAVSQIRTGLKKNMRLLYTLMLRLNQISKVLGQFLNEADEYTSITTDDSMKEFKNFFHKQGLDHFLEIIKNGQWKTFIEEDIKTWVGKYSPLINCLLKYKEKIGLGGTDKMYVDKLINYLTKMQRADILTQFELDVSGVFKSLNLNFISKIPLGLKSTISNNLKLIENAMEVKKQITKNLLTNNPS